MATFLRDWSYRFPWLYRSISRAAALAVGGYERLRRLPLQGIPIQPQDWVLDLCGSLCPGYALSRRQL